MTTTARVASILLLAICMWSAVQKPHRDQTTADNRNVPTERQSSVQTGQKQDPAQIKQDADDLARLASTVPAEVERANKGVVSKDLKDKMKRIEKLSKKLRSELGLN